VSKKNVIETIKNLKKEISPLVDERLSDFKKNINKNDDELFVELCFCIIVANNSIENALRAYNSIGLDFLKLNDDQLKNKLKITARRFYNKRAEYIINARNIKDEFYKKINELKKYYLENNLKTKKPKTSKQKDKNYFEFESEFRNWLANNIKGFGLKEASHYMRNLGFFNFAILDRHILKFLYKNQIIKEIPKTITKKNYFDIEKIIINLAEELNMNMAELDVYLFYIDSGRICEK